MNFGERWNGREQALEPPEDRVNYDGEYGESLYDEQRDIEAHKYFEALKSIRATVFTPIFEMLDEIEDMATEIAFSPDNSLVNAASIRELVKRARAGLQDRVTV